MLALMVAAPLLLTALLVGVVVSLIQAVTQIQEQTLTFIPKLLLIGARVRAHAAVDAAQLIEYLVGVLAQPADAGRRDARAPLVAGARRPSAGRRSC